MFRSFLILAFAVACALTENSAFPDAEVFQMGDTDKFAGEACQLGRQPVNAKGSNAFYACMKPADASFIWEGMGVWTGMKCKGTKVFSPAHGFCRSSRSVKRRQQQYCANFPSYCQQPQPVVQQSCFQPPCQQPVQPSCQQTRTCVDNGPKPCPSATGQRAQGQPCSWMMEQLCADPSNNKCYLQCVPASPGQYCGRWMQRPCPAGTKFSASAQVCVHDTQGCAPQCPQPQQQCNYMGPCNQQQRCPGATNQCVQQTCCAGGGGGNSGGYYGKK